MINLVTQVLAGLVAVVRVVIHLKASADRAVTLTLARDWVTYSANSLVVAVDLAAKPRNAEEMSKLTYSLTLKKQSLALKLI